MSERFEIKPSINKTGYVVIDNKKQYTFPIMSKDDCYMFCKVLNALHEENKKLKQEIENGIESFKRIQRCHTLALVEENEQLKNNIKEAYNNERTMIGQSVLKQLMETIQ